MCCRTFEVQQIVERMTMGGYDKDVFEFRMIIQSISTQPGDQAVAAGIDMELYCQADGAMPSTTLL